MPQTVADALRDASFVVDETIYQLIGLPPRAISVAAGIIAELGEPFCALIVDANEVTLMMPQPAVEAFERRLVEAQHGEHYRLITVDAVLEPDLIGFMAVLSTALAAAQVGVFPYAAYTRDHILVPAGQIEQALAALNELKAAH